MTASPSEKTSFHSEVPRVDSPLTYDISSDEAATDPHHIFESWGVPERHIHSIGHAILAELTQRGIDPDTVVLSGYREGEGATELDAQKAAEYDYDWDREDLELRISEINAELLQRNQDGTLSDKIRQQLLQERADHKAKLAAPAQEKLPNYFFAPVENMFDDSGVLPNPILYAGSSPAAIIGVYDAQRLLVLDPDSSAEIVRAKRSDIESTKLLEFHPRFKRVNPLNP